MQTLFLDFHHYLDIVRIYYSSLVLILDCFDVYQVAQWRPLLKHARDGVGRDNQYHQLFGLIVFYQASKREVRVQKRQ